MGSSEQAVIVHYTPAGGTYADEQQRADVYALGDRLATVVEAAGVGEFDGNGFGAGYVELFAHGPDATRLFATMEPLLRGFPARPAYATLLFGRADDPRAVEKRIDL